MVGGTAYSRTAAWAVALLMLFPAAGVTDPLMAKEDWEFLTAAGGETEKWKTDETDGPVRHATGDLAVTLSALFGIYRLLISSQDQPSCNFTPTCSVYAREAVRKHGPAAGLIMAADRLQRCHGMGKGYYPLNPSSGKLHDPVP